MVFSTGHIGYRYYSLRIVYHASVYVSTGVLFGRLQKRRVDVRTAGDARVSVRAAHFLASIREGIDDGYKGKAAQDESPAAQRMFSGMRSTETTARHTPVTEEVMAKETRS